MSAALPVEQVLRGIELQQMPATGVPEQSPDALPRELVRGDSRPSERTEAHALPVRQARQQDALAVEYEKPQPVVVLPRHGEPTLSLIPLQQWEGVVTQVGDEEFTVTLRDLTHPDNPQEEAVLYVDDVPAEDRPLLVPGAVLYWSIGYQTIRNTGQVQRVSDIRFRRLPTWSRRDVQRVEERARALRKTFGADDDVDEAAGNR